MSQYTENYHLEKPESNDDFENFLDNYGSNMDIIDEHLGQGGGGGNVDDVLVNGVSVVDENHDAQITSYKEVTQAEYDALPATKLTDGIAYFIKDAGGGGGGGGSSSHNYSTTEQVIGTWIDGKPLYQKTFSYTPSFTISTTTPIASLSSEIEVKNLQGVCINNQNSRVISLSYSGSNLGTNFGISASNVLQIEIYNDSWGTNYTFYATIQYTKTTD